MSLCSNNAERTRTCAEAVQQHFSVLKLEGKKNQLMIEKLAYTTHVQKKKKVRDFAPATQKQISSRFCKT